MINSNDSKSHSTHERAKNHFKSAVRPMIEAIGAVKTISEIKSDDVLDNLLKEKPLIESSPRKERQKGRQEHIIAHIPMELRSQLNKPKANPSQRIEKMLDDAHKAYGKAGKRSSSVNINNKK